MNFELVYFRNSFEDIFGFDENFRTVNIAEAETYGLEAGFEIGDLYNFRIKGSYTYTVSKDKSAGSDDYDLKLLRRPQNKALLSVDYDLNDQFFIGADVRFIGARDDKNFSIFPFERIELAPYTLTDLNAAFTLTDNIDIFGKVDNLFDKDYQEVLFYGTLGRAFYFGLKINY